MCMHACVYGMYMCVYITAFLRNFNMFHRRTEENDVTTLYDLLFHVILVREKECTASGVRRGITGLCSHRAVPLLRHARIFPKLYVSVMENSQMCSN